jgi:ribosomal protein L11 methyltransferase
MFRLTFRVPPDSKEEVLDGVLPLLPAGVREEETPDRVLLTSIAGTFPSQAELEAAAGRALEGFAVDEVPADWRLRQAGGVVIGGRVSIRAPWDPPPPGDGVLDVVVERRGSAFGSGSHPTTQMCVALMLELEVSGGAADLGCGVGTLAIAAAKLGWAPVVGVDRVPVAIEVALENVARNDVAVACSVADLAVDDVPLASLLLVNAPPPVQFRVAAAVDAGVRHVIVSGIVADEVPEVIARYKTAGFEVAQALGTEDEWIALRLSS